MQHFLNGDHKLETDANGDVWHVWQGERIVSVQNIKENGDWDAYPWDKDVGEKAIPMFCEFMNANYDGEYDVDEMLKYWKGETDDLTEEEK